VNPTEPTQPDSRRRRLINRLLATWAGGAMVSVFYPVARYLVPPEIAEAVTPSVSAGPLASLPANSAKIVPFGSAPVILVKTGEGELRAFSATCTHLACTVQYRPDLAEIWCACHNGIYDLNGRNISGPPPAPLTAFDVTLKGDEMVIVRRT
jgi:Rieske Fe-S protein